MAHRDTKPARLSDDPRGDLASLERLRADLAERLRMRRSEIAEAVFARFRDIGFDPAAGENAEYVAGSHAAIAESVDYGLGAIERGEEWFGSIPPATVAQARRAARNGVSLEQVLLRNNAGHTVLEDFVMQEVDLAGHSMVLRGVFGTLGALLDHFTALLAHEYQRELERTARSPERRRTELVQKLLAGAPVDTAEFAYRFDAEHLGVIASGARARELVRALATGLGRELLSVSPGEETVWAWLGGRRALDIAALSRLVSASEPAGVSVTIGGSGSGIDGWRLTHRQAQAAMLVAERRPQQLTRYADVSLLAAVLRDQELASSLVEVHLSPLDGHRDSAVSRETLRAYFAAGCNAATAAAALRVDRHTVERRLNSIETRLGRPLHTCRAELEVALRIEELGVPTGPSGDGQSPAR
jgi:PucR C-terminal helix-turn-helix domain/GGDEF-like domain